MTNLEYYVANNLSSRIIFRVLHYDMYNSVVCIYYNPKHSSEPIKIKSDVVFNDNVEEYKLKWWLSDYNNVNFSCLVDNPEDYKHIKRCVKPIDKYYDGVDNEYLFDL